MKYNPGKMKYFKKVEPGIPLYLYIGVAAAGAFLVVVIVCLVCAYQRKRRQQKKNILTFEKQMTSLESKVARECREGLHYL